MPLDSAQWHSPGKANLLLTIAGKPRRRSIATEVLCVLGALAAFDTICWLLLGSGQ